MEKMIMAKRLCCARAILYSAHEISLHKKYQPIQSKLNWNWWLKKDRCKRSFLLNFIRTQMNQLVSVKQMRSSFYVCKHLAFTFSSNASRRSLAIFMICDSYFVSSIKIIFTFIWFFYYYCCWFFVFVCWSMAFVTLYCFWLFNA